MYIVVSYWQAKAGKEMEFEKLGKEMGAVLKSQSGVVFLEMFKSGDKYVAVHAYESEARYKTLVEANDSVFATEMAKIKFDEVGEWLSSERGEALKV